MVKLTKRTLPSPAAIALRQAAAEAERLAADLRRRADLLDGVSAAGVKPGRVVAKKRKPAKAKKRAAKKVAKKTARKVTRRATKKAPRRAARAPSR
jgi:hypothetical protein